MVWIVRTYDVRVTPFRSVSRKTFHERQFKTKDEALLYRRTLTCYSELYELQEK